MRCIVCLSFVLVSSFFNSCSKKNDQIQPQWKTITEAVYASGNVVPANEYKVYALADGVILRKQVQEGDTVVAGQELFILDSEEQNAKNQAAKEIYQTAKENYSLRSPALQELEMILSTARSRFTTDSTNFARYKSLYESKSLSQAEFDKASLSFQSAQNEYFAAQRRFESRKKQLFVELQNAESQYRVQAKQHDNVIIRSAIRGMVYEIYKEQGEVIRRNEPIALLGDAHTIILRLQVDEMDINKVRVGQEALIKIDVYKGKTFRALISKVYPMLNKMEQSFRVDARFIDSIPTTFVGLSVEANIIVQHKDRALVIPKSVILLGDSVEVRENDTKKKIKIQKGLETFEWVEVVSGLTEQSVILPTK